MSTKKRPSLQAAGRNTKTSRAPTRYGARLISALNEALAIERGEVSPARVSRHVLTARASTADPAPSYAPAQIKLLRAKLRLSQAVFGAALNVSPDTVRAWEQGKRSPEGAALRLLEITEQHPGWIRSAVYEK
jgi:putative transcriptional regulator